MQNSDWEHALENTPLTEDQKHQHRIVIRWFLGFCRKRKPPAPPGRDLANEFDRKVLRNRKPPDWQLGQWRAGLRWFLEFLGEPPQPKTSLGDPRGGAPVSEAAQAVASDAPGRGTGAPVHGEKPAEEQGQRTEPPGGNRAWRLTMIGQLRLKHLSYRTEQTYLEWVSRFAGFLKGRNPLTATDEDVVDFLSDLAVRKQVAGSTQNQAFDFNACDFSGQPRMNANGRECDPTQNRPRPVQGFAFIGVHSRFLQSEQMPTRCCSYTELFSSARTFIGRALSERRGRGGNRRCCRRRS